MSGFANLRVWVLPCVAQQCQVDPVPLHEPAPAARQAMSHSNQTDRTAPDWIRHAMVYQELGQDFYAAWCAAGGK